MWQRWRFRVALNSAEFVLNNIDWRQVTSFPFSNRLICFWFNRTIDCFVLVWVIYCCFGHDVSLNVAVACCYEQCNEMSRACHQMFNQRNLTEIFPTSSKHSVYDRPDVHLTGCKKILLCRWLYSNPKLNFDVFALHMNRTLHRSWWSWQALVDLQELVDLQMFVVAAWYNKVHPCDYKQAVVNGGFFKDL